jgi:hypothetical protein
MKAEDFKNMVREIIREELSSLVQEQAEQWWLKPAEAETDPHMEPNLVHEDEYDRKRDAELDKNPMWGYNRQRYTPPKTKPVKNPAKTFRQLFIKTMVAGKIKYKDAEGKEHEATVASLLKYPKDHPGYKAAARHYASGIQRAPKDEGICEGEGCIDEKSVPQPYNRKGARKMSKSQIEKRRKIGRDMMANEKTVSKFRKKYGDEWKDYLWAAASSAVFRQSGSTKSDDKRKK